MFRNSLQINRRLCAITLSGFHPNRNTLVRTLWWSPLKTGGSPPSILSSKCSSTTAIQFMRGKKDDGNLSALFKPVPVRSNPDDISIGAELTGKLDKGELLKVLNRFTQKRETKMMCMENGLDSKKKLVIFWLL